MEDAALNGSSNLPEYETVETLQEKLEEYKEGLKSVEEALQLNSDQPELHKLSADLKELVSLYQDLVNLRTGSGSDKKDDGGRVEASSPDEQGLGAKLSESRGPDAAVGAVSAGGSRQDAASPSGVGNSNTSLLRRACYAPYEDGVYTAIIVQADSSLQTSHKRVLVEFVGWGNSEELPLDSIELLPMMPPSLCTPGTKCWAIYPDDGLWYRAVVNEPCLATSLPSLPAYRVTFAVIQPSDGAKTVTTSNFCDQVSLAQPTRCLGKTRYPVASSASSTASSDARQRKIRQIVTPGGYRIPESLQIRPHDSDKVKQLKKKKISVLKKEQRKEFVEQEARSRQSNWKSHCVKALKNPKMLGRQVKGSIFKTTDAVDGRVGVTGSGSKMTKFQARSKNLIREE